MFASAFAKDPNTIVLVANDNPEVNNITRSSTFRSSTLIIDPTKKTITIKKTGDIVPIQGHVSLAEETVITLLYQREADDAGPSGQSRVVTLPPLKDGVYPIIGFKGKTEGSLETSVISLKFPFYPAHYGVHSTEGNTVAQRLRDSTVRILRGWNLVARDVREAIDKSSGLNQDEIIQWAANEFTPLVDTFNESLARDVGGLKLSYIRGIKRKGSAANDERIRYSDIIGFKHSLSVTMHGDEKNPPHESYQLLSEAQKDTLSSIEKTLETISTRSNERWEERKKAKELSPLILLERDLRNLPTFTQRYAALPVIRREEGVYTELSPWIGKDGKNGRATVNYQESVTERERGQNILTASELEELNRRVVACFEQRKTLAKKAKEREKPFSWDSGWPQKKRIAEYGEFYVFQSRRAKSNTQVVTIPENEEDLIVSPDKFGGGKLVQFGPVIHPTSTGHADMKANSGRKLREVYFSTADGEGIIGSVLQTREFPVGGRIKRRTITGTRRDNMFAIFNVEIPKLKYFGMDRQAAIHAGFRAMGEEFHLARVAFETDDSVKLVDVRLDSKSCGKSNSVKIELGGTSYLHMTESRFTRKSTKKGRTIMTAAPEAAAQAINALDAYIDSLRRKWVGVKLTDANREDGEAALAKIAAHDATLAVTDAGIAYATTVLAVATDTFKAFLRERIEPLQYSRLRLARSSGLAKRMFQLSWFPEDKYPSGDPVPAPPEEWRISDEATREAIRSMGVSWLILDRYLARTLSFLSERVGGRKDNQYENFAAAFAAKCIELGIHRVLMAESGWAKGVKEGALSPSDKAEAFASDTYAQEKAIKKAARSNMQKVAPGAFEAKIKLALNARGIEVFPVPIDGYSKTHIVCETKNDLTAASGATVECSFCRKTGAEFAYDVDTNVLQWMLKENPLGSV